MSADNTEPVASADAMADEWASALAEAKGGTASELTDAAAPSDSSRLASAARRHERRRSGPINRAAADSCGAGGQARVAGYCRGLGERAREETPARIRRQGNREPQRSPRY